MVMALKTYGTMGVDWEQRIDFDQHSKRNDPGQYVHLHDRWRGSERRGLEQCNVNQRRPYRFADGHSSEDKLSHETSLAEHAAGADYGCHVPARAVQLCLP